MIFLFKITKTVFSRFSCQVMSLLFFFWVVSFEISCHFICFDWIDLIFLGFFYYFSFIRKVLVILKKDLDPLARVWLFRGEIFHYSKLKLMTQFFCLLLHIFSFTCRHKTEFKDYRKIFFSVSEMSRKTFRAPSTAMNTFVLQKNQSGKAKAFLLMNLIVRKARKTFEICFQIFLEFFFLTWNEEISSKNPFSQSVHLHVRFMPELSKSEFFAGFEWRKILLWKLTKIFFFYVYILFWFIFSNDLPAILLTAYHLIQKKKRSISLVKRADRPFPFLLTWRTFCIKTPREKFSDLLSRDIWSLFWDMALFQSILCEIIHEMLFKFNLISTFIR